MTISMTEARAAKALVLRLLHGIDGVAGIGLTWDSEGQPSVLVNVQKRAKAKVQAQLARQPIPVPILIEEVGVITFEDQTH